jgi:CheY-like chemotaxis protein
MIGGANVTLAVQGPVIMVDDNEGDLTIARTCFRRSVLVNPWISFTSGPAFLDHLEEVRARRAPMPALVLLDINMPELSGLEVLARVRSTPFFKDLPLFCMLTSSTDPHDRARAKELGCSGFVVKPEEPEDYVAFFDTLAANAG